VKESFWVPLLVLLVWAVTLGFVPCTLILIYWQQHA
jgi:hypothetical protein